MENHLTSNPSETELLTFALTSIEQPLPQILASFGISCSTLLFLRHLYAHRKDTPVLLKLCRVIAAEKNYFVKACYLYLLRRDISVNSIYMLLEDENVVRCECCQSVDCCLIVREENERVAGLNNKDDKKYNKNYNCNNAGRNCTDKNNNENNIINENKNTKLNTGNKNNIINENIDKNKSITKNSINKNINSINININKKNNKNKNIHENLIKNQNSKNINYINYIDNTENEEKDEISNNVSNKTNQAGNIEINTLKNEDDLQDLNMLYGLEYEKLNIDINLNQNKTKTKESSSIEVKSNDVHFTSPSSKTPDHTFNIKLLYISFIIQLVYKKKIIVKPEYKILYFIYTRNHYMVNILLKKINSIKTYTYLLACSEIHINEDTLIHVTKHLNMMLFNDIYSSMDPKNEYVLKSYFIQRNREEKNKLIHKYWEDITERFAIDVIKMCMDKYDEDVEWFKRCWECADVLCIGRKEREYILCAWMRIFLVCEQFDEFVEAFEKNRSIFVKEVSVFEAVYDVAKGKRSEESLSRAIYEYKEDNKYSIVDIKDIFSD